MTLSNEAKEYQGAFEGIYHYRGSLNGMDYFIDTQEVNALWYKPTDTDYIWIVGTVGYLDSYSGGIFSNTNDPAMEKKCPNNEGHIWDWKYLGDSDWIATNDISIKCVSENDFCTSDNPCAHNEGDCDINLDCQSGLACGSNNCPDALGVASDMDCCFGISEGDEHFCTTLNTCGLDQGDCDANDECMIGLVCGIDNCNYNTSNTGLDCCYNATIGDNHFCASGIPCGMYEGDCDSDDECENDLICGTDNCNFNASLGFPTDLDCCYTPMFGDPDWCTVSSPCGVDEGGCNSYDECQTDLFCDVTNGCPSSLGFDSGVACCSDAEGCKCTLICIHFSAYLNCITYVLGTYFFVINRSNF